MLLLLVLIIVHHHMLTIAKNNFLILGLGPTFGINGSFGSPEKKLVLLLLKQIQNFA